MRPFWVAGGLFALILGVIGIFLPLLPTVPFLLLSAFCFARGSTRLHAWLLGNRHFGPSIRDWQNRGAISRKAKIAASISMVAAIGLAIAFGVPKWIIGLQAATLLSVAVFVWTRPGT
ncbi:MAG: YbaN family protein [Rhodobacteraceae bacterium]|nr:YbaN family protein [Paracoccaceae bacterium]